MARQPAVTSTSAPAGRPIEVGGATDLPHVLGVRAPVDASLAPPTLSFRRKREVAIPWGEVPSQLAADIDVSITALREHFERSWNLSAAPDATQLGALTSGAAARIVRIGHAARTASAHRWHRGAQVRLHRRRQKVVESALGP